MGSSSVASISSDSSSESSDNWILKTDRCSDSSSWSCPPRGGLWLFVLVVVLVVFRVSVVVPQLRAVQPSRFLRFLDRRPFFHHFLILGLSFQSLFLNFPFENARKLYLFTFFSGLTAGWVSYHRSPSSCARSGRAALGNPGCSYASPGTQLAPCDSSAIPRSALKLVGTFRGCPR